MPNCIARSVILLTMHCITFNFKLNIVNEQKMVTTSMKITKQVMSHDSINEYNRCYVAKKLHAIHKFCDDKHASSHKLAE